MLVQDKSNPIKEALRQGFRDGTSRLSDHKYYEYNRIDNGLFVINTEEAKIVQRVFESFRDGDSIGKIAKDLEKSGISSSTGRAKWNREVIFKLLSNERYVRNVPFQKTISENGYHVKNQGEFDQVLIQNHHTS